MQKETIFFLIQQENKLNPHCCIIGPVFFRRKQKVTVNIRVHVYNVQTHTYTRSDFN